MQLFFTSVKPYFKNVLNSIELPLCSVFYTTHPFVKNLTTLKTSGEKLFCYQRNIFFQNSKLRNGMAPSINKSSHRRCSIRKTVLRNSAKFTGKHLYQIGFLIKKETLAQLFSCEFAKVLRTPFSQNTSGDCFGIKVF